ncbi:MULTISPECIES: genetic competence negative regulator [unclassified Paenibacillus]|uniref:genetic competence negative regulator n=1 Tax=unclassified Paenibacillus TaxID=185978 RepID=UPI0009548ED3|nr:MULTISPECIES: genetic competence negative regulator [unclassified Paenibacillus]ASS65100.1 genetic competence negative regulator [Paenibacillus sp. RUD330]SIQ48464.1 adapter protein MecA 1/2 [Paenibacillus sp. RU4X]SIQ70362.1 adapter protein MecA 1/2 [Paenibacillus sp. RU4T]
MKIERLGQDKIRIFLTFDDLLERGIQKDDMWREIPKVHELFSEMMDQAYSELGFDANGPLAVEVIAMPAQGMVVIVTRGKMNVSSDAGRADEDDADEDMYEMEVTLESSDTIMYMFKDFEDVISAAKQLSASELTEEGRLYAYNGRWILAFDTASAEPAGQNAMIAILAEFGDATSVTYAVLEEYGKIVMPTDAVRGLCHHFKS